MKNLLKNKLALTLILVLFVTIVLDMFVNGLIQNILTNDTLKTMAKNPTDLVAAELSKNINGWLTGASPTTATVMSVTVEKSSLILFVYGLSLAIGVMQLGLAGTIIFFSLKQEGSTKMVVMIAGAFVLFMAIYGVAAGALKFAGGTEETFVYQLTATDVAVVTTNKANLTAKVTELVTAEVTRLAGLTENAAAMGAKITELATADATAGAAGTAEQQARLAEVARLMGLGMNQAAATQSVYSSVAASALYAQTAQTTVLASAGYTQLTTLYGQAIIGQAIGYSAGGSFSDQISEWMNNEAYQNTLKWLLSATGIAGTLAMASTGYALSKAN